MGTTIYDVFEKIIEYNGDLKRDTKQYRKNGKEKLRDQFGKLYRDLEEIISDDENQFVDIEYYTVKDAARYWGISEQTVYNKIKDKTIRVVRNGRNLRIPKSSLKDFFRFNYNTNLILCNTNHELKDENNNIITTYKANSAFKLVYLGSYVVTLFDLENNCKITISTEHYHKEFRVANNIERDALKYRM